MQNPCSKLNDLLNGIESNCDPTVGSPECTQFSLDCLALIRHKLPPIAQEGISVVRDYYEGRVPLQVVADTLTKCWQYLDQHHKNVPFAETAVSAIRAVIFPLSAQTNPQDKDIVDHLSLFLKFVNNVEPHYEEEESLLRTHFSKCL